MNLALGIPSIAQRYGARLPRYLKPEEVEALLAALPTDTAKGRRNYAMVLMLFCSASDLRGSRGVVAIQLATISTGEPAKLMVRGKAPAA